MGWVGCPSGILRGVCHPSKAPWVSAGEGQPDHERHQCHLCTPGNRGLHRGPQPQRALPLQLLHRSRPGKIPLGRILGTPPGLFSNPQGVLCLFPNPCWGGGFSSAGATYFRLVPREMSHPLEASTSHKNGGMEALELGMQRERKGEPQNAALCGIPPPGCSWRVLMGFCPSWSSQGMGFPSCCSPSPSWNSASPWPPPISGAGPPASAPTR